MKTTIPTRRSEISFYTSDPASMLNKYVAEDVNRIYTQTVVDSDTGETVEIERSERLFNRGTFIDQHTLESIRFSLAAGEIKRIRVSNQCRLAKETKGYGLHPFRAKALIRGKAHSFILYAKSVSTALLIIADYIELNFEGTFAIAEIKVVDYITILTDPGFILPEECSSTHGNEALALHEDDEEVPHHEEDEACDNKDEEKDKTKNYRFYQINTHITSITLNRPGKEDKREYDQDFLVHTSSCARANCIILYWLRLCQLNENRRLLAEDPDAETVEKLFLSEVEESKVVPIRHYIPREFSLAYSDYDDPQPSVPPIGSYTYSEPLPYSNSEDKNPNPEDKEQ